MLQAVLPARALARALYCGVCLYAVSAAVPALEGQWSCPAEIRVGSSGTAGMNLFLNTRPVLFGDGRYRSEGEAVLPMGGWPLMVGTTSDGVWVREGRELTLTVRTLELSPVTEVAPAFQQYLIEQLRPMLPPLPHTQTVLIVEESDAAITLEDDYGDRVSCERVVKSERVDATRER